MVMRKVESPTGTRTVIHAFLKPRWEFDPTRSRFVSGRREYVLGEHLPPGTEIHDLVGRLRSADRKSLSAEEKKLSRWVQILLPEGTQPEDVLANLQAWPCFVEAHVVPQPSLPSAGGIRPPM